RLVPEDPDSDIEDRDEALQPDLTEAERNRKVSGEARAARDRDNTYHAVQLGEAIPSQGLDVLNKQQHQVINGLTLHMCMAATYPT
ncbi:hypothetical protein, partial [Neoaquamicrobium sediminum]|uniref:hypothetical protein n=1 Tax=Neoaquamicrobium sediminum TaxID=1849104 RepID=UPI004036898D